MKKRGPTKDVGIRHQDSVLELPRLLLPPLVIIKGYCVCRMSEKKVEKQTKRSEEKTPTCRCQADVNIMRAVARAVTLTGTWRIESIQQADE